MQRIKKYLAIVGLLMVFPLILMVSNKFILESTTEIYSYIPQESDFVIEINTTNFIKEIAYQRIFEEASFLEKVYPASKEKAPEPLIEDTGLDFFGKVIFFRELWPDEAIWFAIVAYSDEALAREFLTKKSPESKFEFSEDYVIIQLTNSQNNQDKIAEHLKKISNKEVKGFNERIDLTEIFNPKKEINCYFTPRKTPENKLIDGWLSFDFLNDRIDINGQFTPIKDAEKSTTVAYAIDKTKAFSVRSSLNIFNSIYWFKEDIAEDIPSYSQLAMDYDGVDCYLVHRNQGYSTPFRSYPKIALHFDILETDYWTNFFETQKIAGNFSMVGNTGEIMTPHGASFNYKQTDKIVELYQDSMQLKPSTDEHLLFDLWIQPDMILERTSFMVDSINPPSSLEQNMGLLVADKIISDFQALANMATIELQLTESEDGLILAKGQVLMEEKNGHSMIESMSFGMSMAKLLKNY
jgi:hypothetical protein